MIDWCGSLDEPWQKTIAFSPQILSQEDKPLRLFTTKGGFWRFPVNIQAVDKKYIQALIAYEDKRFYRHRGVDFISLIRAVGQLIWQQRIISGASTLSMQTIRLLQPRPRSIVNKLREMVQALRMERQFDKQQILTHYLNLAPFGGNIQGVEAASFFYFGKSPKRLTYSEIALLIALPQAPEQRRPDRFYHAAIKARNRVLRRLYQAGIMDKQDYQLGLKQTLPKKRFATPFHAPHLSERLKRYAHTENGFRLRSSISFPIQLQLEQLLARYHDKIPSGETIAAMVVNNRNGAVLAHMGSANYWHASQVDLTRAIRSPGSTLKPFVYGLGFERKLFHPQTWVMDQPLRMDDGYGPQNFNQKFYGQVSLSTALRRSLNIPAIKALQKVGVENFLARLNRVGIKLALPSYQKPGLAIALGGVGISLENLAALYSALANQGKFRPLIYRSPKINLTSISQPRSRRMLLSPQASGYIDNILQGVDVPDGYESVGEQKVRFKTGTSYGYRDVWSVGYNSRYTVALWRGRPDGGFTQNHSGLAFAAPPLLDLFNHLPVVNEDNLFALQAQELSWPGNRQLPIAMQWLDKPAKGYLAEKPIIRYPLDGSLIELRQQQPVLLLKAQSGTPPYFWLVNGEYQATLGDGAEYQWPIKSKGIIRITLIDSLGQQAFSQVRLK